MDIEAIRMMANDANVRIDNSLLKFAELLAERCAVIAERQDGSGEAVAESIRDYFAIADYSPRV